VLDGQPRRGPTIPRIESDSGGFLNQRRFIGYLPGRGAGAGSTRQGAAPSVLIGAIAVATARIRVGDGLESVLEDRGYLRHPWLP
jgi:hypothetical protein